MKKNIPFLGLATAVILSTGCGNALRSEYRPPVIDYPAHWQEAGAAGTSVPFNWDDFNDPALTRWLDLVVARNNDLALAVLRIYRARLNEELTGIEHEPVVAGKVDSGANRRLNRASPWNKSSSATVNVSYEVDLWGKLARQQDAAVWEREATEHDLDVARLTLLANASTNYWQLAFLNQRIVISQQSIEHAEDSLRLVTARFNAGNVSALDMIAAEQNVANQENDHLALLSERKIALNAQSVLLGTLTGNSMINPAHLPSGPLPRVNPGIPATVLACRPDIKALELRLREALANVDVQRAQLYPAFSLTGSLGTSSSGLTRFLRNPVATADAGLTLPFLQWREMNINVKIARNDYEQRVIDFKQALYKAMAAVDNSLTLHTQLLEQEKQLNNLLELALKSEKMYEIRYRNGATPINFWLDAQETRRQAQVALDINRYTQLQNLAQIYLELGGDCQ
ncbi:TolC family protein [Brenneria goodwinii]|uniref:TolC family protein n=1 Tax=Brenneria goodwinii TaxID=1109412 RepID=UPI000EF194F6|nr:TolC family protein [Brenneria goodwinii]MCG8154870.1 TolC family protein [Brenneria goodwinii]MCG8159793.1 TolC family protein [Brenneria goodwinii]MCG8164108.1 TolC family protein [Brenneria goodwinii]MCG8168717.1 TolC family protein [Brenneria goodwinii]MCG8173728.1 TolC family protein [Brenneria goodwinii]